jgi:hypothetical protein
VFLNHQFNRKIDNQHTQLQALTSDYNNNIEKIKRKKMND